jgi:glycine/D-amino acid oxidase-like deaminating enzyme
MTFDNLQISYWHDSLPEAVQARPVLESDIDADVVIIGAGYTGLWTAYYLKKIDPALNIVVLEAKIAGFGASGRNGGWCTPFISGIEHWLNNPLYKDPALRLKRLMIDTVSEIGRVTELEAIDCHNERSGALEIAVLPEQLKRLRDEFNHQRDLGFGEDVYSWLDAKELGEVLKVDKALAGIRAHQCAAVHPARLARGLADCVEGLGVKIYEHSPVQTLNGQVVTAAGYKVNANTTLVTTEGYSGGLFGHKQRLIPVHSMMVATEPLSREQINEIGFRQRYTFANYDRVTTYGQLTADNRIAFGCRGTYLFASGIQHKFEHDDSEFELVRNTLLRFFPALQGVRFTHAWGGAMGVSRSLRPSVNFDPDKGVGWAGGFFGNGVAATHLAGQTLADLVTAQQTERLDTPWVNPAHANRRWEPEPLRWLGVRSTRTLMGVADRFEYQGGRPGSFFAKILDMFMPNL